MGHGGEMRLIYSSKSDIGLVREVNQDRWADIHCEWGDLFVVADGLGHKDGGQFASQTAVELLKDRFAEKDPGDIPEFLKQTIDYINDIIYTQKLNTYDNVMMGSTCVILVIQGPRAFLAHAGDSRAYRLHNGELSQLTKDHSLVQKMVDDGLITESQAETHPHKNIVMQALGSNLEINAEILQNPLSLSAGDRFLLCSDGLWGLVSLEILRDTLRLNDPEVTADELITQAKKNGGYDNITVQVIHTGDYRKSRIDFSHGE